MTLNYSLNHAMNKQFGWSSACRYEIWMRHVPYSVSRFRCLRYKTGKDKQNIIEIIFYISKTINCFLPFLDLYCWTSRKVIRVWIEYVSTYGRVRLATVFSLGCPSIKEEKLFFEIFIEKKEKSLFFGSRWGWWWGCRGVAVAWWWGFGVGLVVGWGGRFIVVGLDWGFLVAINEKRFFK